MFDTKVNMYNILRGQLVTDASKKVFSSLDSPRDWQLTELYTVNKPLCIRKFGWLTQARSV